MYSGSDAINFLVDEINKEDNDAAASSHWQHYHSTFHFTGSGFEGLRGFGGYKKPHAPYRLGLERLLQYKFRLMGRQYSGFEEIDVLAHKITKSQIKAYDLDVLRQSITLAFLKTKIPHIFLSKKAACIIGDGFGSMTALLSSMYHTKSIILVNLNKTLLVDLWFLKKYMGENFEKSVDLVVDEQGLKAALLKKSEQKIIAFQAINHQLIQHTPTDLIINIASMQEMDPNVIRSYFEVFRSISGDQKLYFYCCNREEKKLPDGTITRFLEYPWQEKDQIIVDELCPWHQQYYTLLPPFYRPYDGEIRHRLVEMI